MKCLTTKITHRTVCTGAAYCCVERYELHFSCFPQESTPYHRQPLWPSGKAHFRNQFQSQNQSRRCNKHKNLTYLLTYTSIPMCFARYSVCVCVSCRVVPKWRKIITNQAISKAGPYSPYPCFIPLTCSSSFIRVWAKQHTKKRNKKNTIWQHMKETGNNAKKPKSFFASWIRRWYPMVYRTVKKAVSEVTTVTRTTCNMELTNKVKEFPPLPSPSLR